MSELLRTAIGEPLFPLFTVFLSLLLFTRLHGDRLRRDAATEEQLEELSSTTDGSATGAQRRDPGRG